MSIITTIVEFFQQYIPDFGTYTLEYFLLFAVLIAGIIKLFKG